MPLEITTRDYKRVHVIRVVGRVDSSTAPVLDDKLKEHINAGHKQLVLELDGTNYLSSAGARALIAAQKALKGRGGQVIIAQPSKEVKEVLRLVGFEGLFSIHKTTEEAVGSV